MKLSLNWLKDYVDPQMTTEALVHRLTMAGLEVESVNRVQKDTVLDLEITPNRPDCLNTLGIAREISAICAKKLAYPKIKTIKPTPTNDFMITIADKKDCGRYVGTLIREATVEDSPAWVTERLQSLGLRAIGNAVDVTNFVLMEMGQPLHVFDFDKIQGGKIIVRRAKAGEKIVTLDGIERRLDPSILIIADAKQPIAIAGIMGGLATQVSLTTKNILLESAHFDMGVVRKASRTLGLKSDASYRFERGVDFYNVLDGANRATGLLLELTRAKLSGRMDQGDKPKDKAHVIQISIQDIENLLGTKVSATVAKNAWTRLGLTVTGAKKDNFKITVPSFRNDLKQNVDLIEEVARIIGYDHLNVSFPHIQVVNIAPDVGPRTMRKRMASVLIAKGFYEAVTFSLISQKDLERCKQENLTGVGVENALSGEHNIMRPSMMPSLLNVAAKNFNRGQKDLRLFEIGKCYFLKEERWTLGILASGRREDDWRRNSKEGVEFYDVKGILEQVFSQLDLNIIFEPGESRGFETGAAQLKLNNQSIGVAGRIHSEALQQWGIKPQPIFYAEINLQPMFKQPTAVLKYEPIPDFPGIGRDISMAIKKNIPYEKIKNLCEKLGGAMLQRVSLIEEYTGEKIEKGERGLVLSLQYQSQERTLREEDVSSVHRRIVDSLINDFSAKIR